MSIVKVIQDFIKSDYDISKPVDEKEKMGWQDLFIICLGMWFSMWAVVIGFTIGTMLPPAQAIAACFLGFLATGIYFSIIGGVGAATGKPTTVILERGAGRYGSILFAISVVIVYCWAFGMQADVAGRSVAAALDSKSISLYSGLLAIIMSISGIIGIKGIQRVSWIAVPLFLLVTFYAGLKAVSMYGGLAEALSISFEPTTSFWSAFSMATGSWISFSTMAPDVTRFAKRPKDVYIAGIISFIVGSLLPIMGVLLAATLRTEDMGQVFKEVGIPWLGVIAVFAAAWTTNDNNVYTGGLGLTKLTNWSRPVATALVAFVGIIMAFMGAGATDVIGKSLGWLVSASGPVGGIIIAEYYIVSNMDPAGTKTSGIPGTIALLVGLVLSLLSLGGVWQIIPLPGFVVGVLSGLILTTIGMNIEKNIIEKQNAMEGY